MYQVSQDHGQREYSHLSIVGGERVRLLKFSYIQWRITEHEEMRDTCECRDTFVADLTVLTRLNRSPDPGIMSSDIPVNELPRCDVASCGSLLRPDIVWFGEHLEKNVLQRACM